MDPDSQRLLGERNPGDVVLIGNASHEDLPRYYRSTDIFCSPATGKESFGMVLLEGMAAKKPVVASNIIGYNGVMTDGVEGFLVPPKDENELALALGKLIKEEGLRREMGNRGLTHVQEFSWDKVADKVMRVYSQSKSIYDQHDYR